MSDKSSEGERGDKYVSGFSLLTLTCLLSPSLLPQSKSLNAGDNSILEETDGVSVSSAELSPDSNASSLISSPVLGLLPELTPADLADGVLLFLLQVSGASAVLGNYNLNWALSVNLATRLQYVSVDNLYLLNYSQLPTASGRRRLLDTSSPTAEVSPSSIGEVQAGVVTLPDLQTDTQNLSAEGTGISTATPSMVFMYEVQVADTSYISYIHNQLNSIIATSLLLKDVQAANLTIWSIYLLSFEPAETTAVANTTSVSVESKGEVQHILSLVVFATSCILLLGGASCLPCCLSLCTPCVHQCASLASRQQQSGNFEHAPPALTKGR